MIKKILKKVFRFFYLRKSIQTNRVEHSPIVLWRPHGGFRYWFSDVAVEDFAWEKALKLQGVEYRIKKSWDIGNIHNATIQLSYSRVYLKHFGFGNYSMDMHHIISQLEKQGNRVIPSSDEVLYWENKAYMTARFNELDVSTPRSEICLAGDVERKLEQFGYPLLIKEVHSASAKGVHKVKSYEDYAQLEENGLWYRNESIILQELLDMRRDLRIIFVGDKIVHFYWRINLEEEWRPTSTGQGSKVDFNSFPEDWREFLIEQFRKTKLSTGAFDVAWQRDDLQTIPLILEVSPSYQLNPKVKSKRYLEAYGEYKKSLQLGKSSYDFQYISQTFEVVRELSRFVLGERA